MVLLVNLFIYLVRGHYSFVMRRLELFCYHRIFKVCVLIQDDILVLITVSDD
jgi:hypothetical protein